MDFTIICTGKRPKREMLLRRAISDEGSECVVLEAHIPRGDDPGADWHYEEVVDFGNNVAAMRGYISTFNEAQAKDFIGRAVAEAKKNTEPTEPKEQA